jgi:protein-disulfide isomerase
MSKQQREVSRRERVAEMQKEAAAKERNRRLLIGLAIVVVLSAVVAAFVVFSGGGGPAKTPAATPPATASGQSLVVGSNAKAKYKVVVYEDFLCPYCREFETSSRDFLRAAAQKGTVQIEYRPFHLLQDDYSTRALSAWAAVLQSGTPKQALRLHDLLYDNQPYEQDANKPGTSKLQSWAKKAGVSSSSVLDAMGQADTTFVDAADAAASKAGVTGTPTVFVNGKELSGSSISSMVDNLEREVSGG